MKNLSFKEIKNMNLIPRNSKKIGKDVLIQTLTADEFKKLPVSERVKFKGAVVCNNVVWASQDDFSFYSMDKDGYIWRTAVNKAMITKFSVDVENKSLTLVEPVSLIQNNQIIKEGIKMPNKDELLDVVNRIQTPAGAPSAPTAPISSFNSEDVSEDKMKKERAKQERLRKAKILSSAIQANTENVAIADTTLVSSYNRQRGEVVGYICVNDKKTVASTQKYNLKQGDKFVLSDEGKKNAEISAAFSAGEKVPSSYLLKGTRLIVKEQQPSKPIGIVYKTPVGGFVTAADLSKPGTLEPDTSKEDLVVMALPTDLAAASIIESYDGVINESPKTHGELAGKLHVQLGSAVNKDGITKFKYLFSPSKRKRLVIPGNYIPRKTYVGKTYAQIVSASPEVQNDANRSLFGRMFDPKKNSTDTIYGALDSASKAMIAKDGDTYTSEWLKNGGEPLQITSFANNEEFVSNPVIPTKTWKPKKNKEGEFTASFVTYDVLNPNAEYEAFNPENDQRFAAFKEELGGKSFEEVIRAVTVKKNSNKKKESSRRVFDNEQSIKLLQRLRSGQGLQNAEADFTLGRTESQQLDSVIASIKYRK